jgi:glycosyltransferase involved in cell wall biosynthesis
MMVTENCPLRIAYTPSGGTQWTGGLTYQKNLLTALQEYAPQVKVYLLSDQTDNLPANGENYSYVRYPSNAGLFSVLINKFTLPLFGNDYLLARTLQSIPDENINLVFPGRHGAGKGIAVLNWIPDFQHLHLPEMYSQTQILDLNKKYRQGIKRSTLVILSSKSVLEDFLRFSPEFVHKARVMNFVAHIPPRLYLDDPRVVVEQYHLPEKFVYLPNQFWKHKNHIAVFDALRILKGRNIKPFVVLTGNPVDSRNPLYFANLIQKISEWDLRDQLAFLGLVPQNHVYMLIRQSVCVLNPSLFEGWSTTVEEAKSVGKRVLLSDLPVHREQDPPASVYFNSNDPEQLANVFAECWENVPSGPDTELEHDARQAFPRRMKQFAETFVSIACEAVKHT